MNSGKVSAAERTLLSSSEDAVDDYQTFLAEQALQAYQAWDVADKKKNEAYSTVMVAGVGVASVATGFGASAGLYAMGAEALRNELWPLPDFTDITLRSVIEDQVKGQAVGLVYTKALLSKPVLRKLFPSDAAAKVAKKALTEATEAYEKKLGQFIMQKLSKKVAQKAAAKGAGVTAKAVAKAFASAGPQILAEVAIDTVIAYLEMQIERANAEPRLKANVAEAKRSFKVKRLLATVKGSNEVSAQWAAAMGGAVTPAKADKVAIQKAAGVVLATYEPAPAKVTAAQAPKKAAVQAASKWVKIGGSARDVAVGSDGTTYAIGVKKGGKGGYQIFKRAKTANKWTKISGAATRVAVMGTQAWVVTSDGQIFSQLGNKWKKVPGPAAQDIGASSTGVWIIDVNGKIHKREGNGWTNVLGTAYRIDIDADGIAIGGTDVVAIADIDGQVRTWNSVQKIWTVTPGVSGVSSIGVTPDGRIWAVLQDGGILSNGGLVSEETSTEEDTATAPKPTVLHAPVITAPVRSASTPVPTSVVAQTVEAPLATPTGTAEAVADTAAQGTIAMTGFVDPITVTTKEKITFINTLKTASTLAIGADGSVFGLDSVGNVLRWSNRKKKFDSFPGSLLRIAVDKDGHPWGVSALGRVFRHTGSQWKQIPNATASDISIGFDGTVLTASATGRLYKLNAAQNHFDMIPGTGVTLVAVGPDGTPWAVRSDKLVQRCDVSPCKVYSQKANAIAVGPDGSVFVVSNTSRLMRLDKNGQFKVVQTPGHTPLKVTVGPSGYPWVVSTSNIALASSYFDRDEGADLAEAAATSASGTTGTGTTATVVSTSVSSFTFTKNMRFETVSADGLSPGAYAKLASNPDGVIWASTTGGALEKYDTVQKKFVDGSTKFESDGVDISDFDIAANGDIWVYTLNYNEQKSMLRERNKVLKKYTVSGFTAGGSSEGGVAVSPDGTVYALMTSGSSTYIYTKASNSETFKKFSNDADIVAVSVGPGNDVWIIDKNDIVQQWTGTRFENRPSNGSVKATRIAAGKTDGTIYIVATDNTLRKWNGANSSFDKVNNITGYYVAVDGDGRPWVNTSSTPTIKRGKD